MRRIGSGCRYWCVAERDLETPEELARQIAERAPRGELRSYPGSHFDFYREPMLQQVLADQIDFLHTHLAAPGE